MNDEHSRIRTLKQRWDEDDAARDKQEERAQRSISHVLARIDRATTSCVKAAERLKSLVLTLARDDSAR